MNNGSWKVIYFLLISLFVGDHQVLAGPLDRVPTQRENHLADDMVRVPGVLNLSYDEAMTALQGASLNPVPIRISRRDKQYEGKEGKVVSQLPLPGGITMLGSSVTITYYLPQDPVEPIPESEHAQPVPEAEPSRHEEAPAEERDRPEAGEETSRGSQDDSSGGSAIGRNEKVKPPLINPPLIGSEKPKINWGNTPVDVHKDGADKIEPNTVKPLPVPQPPRDIQPAAIPEKKLAPEKPALLPSVKVQPKAKLLAPAAAGQP